MSSSCSFSNFPLNHSWASIRLRDICDMPQHLTHQHWNIIIIIFMKFCIFSNFPLSLQQVTRCLWHTTPPHQHQQHFQASPSLYELKGQQNICTDQVSYKNESVGATFNGMSVNKQTYPQRKRGCIFWMMLEWQELKKRKLHQCFDFNLNVSFTSSFTFTDIHLASQCAAYAELKHLLQICVCGCLCTCVCLWTTANRIVSPDKILHCINTKIIIICGKLLQITSTKNTTSFPPQNPPQRIRCGPLSAFHPLCVSVWMSGLPASCSPVDEVRKLSTTLSSFFFKLSCGWSQEVKHHSFSFLFQTLQTLLWMKSGS